MDITLEVTTALPKAIEAISDILLHFVQQVDSEGGVSLEQYWFLLWVETVH